MNEWPEIQKVPAVEGRIETGPVQFGEDWPGTFIRGDNAFGYAMYLRTALDFMDKQQDLKGMDWISVVSLRGLVRDLESSNLRNHQPGTPSEAGKGEER